MKTLTEIISEQLDLFVYGTLQPGKENAHKMAGAKNLGKTATAPKYKYRNRKGFPEMSSGEESVPGYRFKVSKKKLNELDNWEDDRYDRKPVTLKDGDKAFAYVTH